MTVVRRSSEGLERPHRFLVLLYGTLEYDGRAQRMIEVLSSLGLVVVLDVGPQPQVDPRDVGVTERLSLALPARGTRIGRHLRFWSAAVRVARGCRPDFVVAEDYFTTFPAWLATRATGARLLYDAYELIIPEPGVPSGWRKRFWYNLERWVIRRSELVIAANPERAQMMAEHYALEKVPVYMRNIVPARPYESCPNDVLSSYPALRRQTPRDRIILYQGYVSLARGLGRFVEAMRYLPPSFRLVVVGDGPDVDSLVALAADLARDGRFASLGRVPNHILPAITANADVGIVSYSFSGLNNIFCAPNKVFEYVSAGLPVLTTDQPPLRAMVEQYGIGELIGPNDSAPEVASALSRLTERRCDYISRFTDFLSDYSWEAEAGRLRSSIRNVMLTSN